MVARTVIISAGGIGKRMGARIPKQFLNLNNRPVLFHTIEKFAQFDPEIQIIVVLPANQIDYWKALCSKNNFLIEHAIVKGGKERFFSVKNGLALAKGKVIGVHDAVRPLVSEAVIANCFATALEKGAAIPVFDINESIREINSNGSIAVNRNNYKLVQTPQCFQNEILKSAYALEFSEQFTDDASVVEKNGTTIHLIEGNEANIKITRPIDLRMAETLISDE
ncbi:MAG: 2-C-methyl-D-erythritol 4-phosphate cytidylyltransferase [Crocinitomix sp.]|nr:2-C-methyl-D-erythritol 4-phosphate cytidylyltransferase [Crocinitomix sp.]